MENSDNTQDLKYCYRYPHPAVATDCVIFTFNGSQLEVLLIERGLEPYKGKWALPGGFLRMDESAEEGAARELREETGISNALIRQFHVFSTPDRDPRERVISIAFLALVKQQEVVGGDDAAKANWFTLDNIPPLAFDHDRILRMALRTLRETIHFEPIGFDLLNEHFTIRQLQNLYEGILDVRFDRRNFYNKMMRLGILDLVPGTNTQNKREAFLFSFNKSKYNELKHKGFRLEF